MRQYTLLIQIVALQAALSERAHEVLAAEYGDWLRFDDVNHAHRAVHPLRETPRFAQILHVHA